MQQRDFGTTGLKVSPLGFGAGHIGTDQITDQDAGTLLNRAVDLGITLIDTARGYGQSEERIGRHLAYRRGDFVLSTKGGYGIDGVDDWTPEAVRRGVEESLARLQTDHIDLFHLHSPPLEAARRDDLLAALHDARTAGLIRVAAYSGENDALTWAVEGGQFGSVQTSVNIADQWSLHHVLPEAQRRGLGVIAKRPLANAAWQYQNRPRGQYAETYWERLCTLAYDAIDLDWTDFALRFSAHAPGVSSAIVGTTRPDHLERNVRIVQDGPLSAQELAHVHDTWQAHGLHWGGEV